MNSLTFSPFRKTALIGDREITIETGKLAKQAHGAVWIQCGGTVVMVTVVTQPLPVDKGFFPLTVEYKELAYAAGRIPGSFFRREVGRPSEREVLVCRLIDRPCRPLFPAGFRDEVQIIAQVHSADDQNDPDVLAICGASTALGISKIPFMGPIAGARIGYLDKKFVFNPTYAQIAESELNLVMAGSREAVVMVEGSAQFAPESLIADAIEWGHQQMQPLLDAQEALRAECGQPKMEVAEAPVDEEVKAAVEEIATPKLREALAIPEKLARYAAKDAVKSEVMASLTERFAEEPARLAPVGEILKDITKSIVRGRIKNERTRIDGRDLTTVRPLGIEVGLLPRTHGSALFARGETMAVVTATMGSTRDEQRTDSLVGDCVKRFMLHYNFPPYCVGEVRMMRGPSRREIGHGALAERAISPILPSIEEFPFTVRVVSEIMESNGSSSMATVCGSSLALMDAGIPVKCSIAGVAMGLIKEDDEYLVLTDILGDEDALGDMDFKVAGSSEGVTAIQMDIKITGIPSEVLRSALAQAKEGRLHILENMEAVIAAPRPELSEYAPQLEVVTVHPDKIRSVIGPGGKNIKAITSDTGADIDIEDDGRVFIFAPTRESLERAKELVLYHDQTAEVGRNYEGRVTRVIDCGVVVEILPGVDGLVHVSQLDINRVEQPGDVAKLGDTMKVKVLEVEPTGRVRLSRKAVLMEDAGQTVDLADFAKTGGGKPRGGDRGGERGGERRGGDRPRGGDRGGDRRGGGGRR
ncbi:polyribonucleotide nucleotidyltransferase [Desulfobaculum xiamenense]|uniref:Polyribonucleotide nucleotidyltransferase n=1 Tax=Desulfobaculum xiamenense TaxID=995050 RepID=A0A846QNL8_9BACT|nr:polyribonucleotide nucleotidyltransferase [Desulfobaculum xiamenense]NJB66995.1 polyribonucleotide nucleotidyltransferase [Desulfobaculum xiamenense]